MTPTTKALDDTPMAKALDAFLLNAPSSRSCKVLECSDAAQPIFKPPTMAAIVAKFKAPAPPVTSAQQSLVLSPCYQLRVYHADNVSPEELKPFVKSFIDAHPSLQRGMKVDVAATPVVKAPPTTVTPETVAPAKRPTEETVAPGRRPKRTKLVAVRRAKEEIAEAAKQVPAPKKSSSPDWLAKAICPEDFQHDIQLDSTKNLGVRLPQKFAKHPYYKLALELHDAHGIPHIIHWRTRLPMSIMAAYLYDVLSDARDLSFSKLPKGISGKHHTEMLQKCTAVKCQLAAWTILNIVLGSWQKSWNGHENENLTKFKQALEEHNCTASLSFLELLVGMVVAEDGLVNKTVLLNAHFYKMFKPFHEKRTHEKGYWSNAWLDSDDGKAATQEYLTTLYNCNTDDKTKASKKSEMVAKFKGLNWELCLILDRVFPAFHAKVSQWGGGAWVTCAQNEEQFGSNLRLWELEP